MKRLVYALVTYNISAFFQDIKLRVEPDSVRNFIIVIFEQSFLTEFDRLLTEHF